jgi:hypothetical protein
MFQVLVATFISVALSFCASVKLDPFTVTVAAPATVTVPAPRLSSEIVV